MSFDMVQIDRAAHWNTIYSTKSETGVSWYQSEPRRSLELIRAVAPPAGARVIDVGGGASVLVDRLRELPFEKVAVLDISEVALSQAKSRLRERAARVEWIVADVTEIQDVGPFDVWHDRAVFHFLTDAADRRKYVDLARRTVPEGGHLIIASFADDGPKRCSDLDVCRYNAESMGAELGEDFALVREAKETHTTPWGSSQAFFYGVFRRHGFGRRSGQESQLPVIYRGIAASAPRRSRRLGRVKGIRRESPERRHFPRKVLWARLHSESRSGASRVITGR
jgi:ubiquinone/menaquinone biosynthesis C-methylase UbiE